MNMTTDKHLDDYYQSGTGLKVEHPSWAKKITLVMIVTVTYMKAVIVVPVMFGAVMFFTYIIPVFTSCGNNHKSDHLL